MGTFVLSLKNELIESIERGIKISEIEKEKETYLAKIDELVSSLETDQKITSQTKNELKQVKARLDSFQKKEDALIRKSLFNKLNNRIVSQNLSSEPRGIRGNLEGKNFRDATSRELINSLTNNKWNSEKIQSMLDTTILESNKNQKNPSKK